MNIMYFEPLSRAFDRMKTALFKPFDLRKWLIVGFNAFLAGLLDGHGSGGSSSRVGGRGDDVTFREFLRFPQTAWEWLMKNPGWFVGIILLVLVFFTILVVLTWLSSRGTFMFLDSVVYDRAEIGKPWREYAAQGNSLFLWKLIYGLIVFLGIILIFFAFFSGASYLYNVAHPDHVPVLFIVMLVIVFLTFLIATGYISLFLTGFVAPLQFKHKITTTRAWGRFLPLLGKHPFHFLLFGFFYFILTFAVVIAIIFAGLMTCCIGFLLLIIPYVGTVVSLPIWYTLRGFSLEYLAQFGPEYDLFPASNAEQLPENV
jgi:hypothetical protein